MIKDIYLKKKLASAWFSLLQKTICYEFEKIEIEFARKKREKPKYFKKNNWLKSKIKNEGGGTFSIIKNGHVFDSVGVNFSEVSGKFHKKFKSQILGAKNNPNYWATGISVVAHMKNPKIPAMHFNTRFIVTTKNWFGGGMDSTPSIKNGVMIISIYLTEMSRGVLVEYFLTIKEINGKLISVLLKILGYVF